MKPSVLVDVTVQIVFPAALVLSLYFLFAGHNQPGGGFVGGLVAGAALALRYVARGYPAVQAVVPVPPPVVAGIGLLVALGTAAVPLVLGDEVLESAKAAPELPVLGTVNLTSALVFDTGVYLVVVGLVMAVLDAFGGEPPEASS